MVLGFHSLHARGMDYQVKFRLQIHVDLTKFSNMSPDWLVAMLPDNQIQEILGLKICVI